MAYTKKQLDQRRKARATYYKKHKKEAIAQERAYEKKNADKVKPKKQARDRINKAVKRGTMKKPTKCPKCGSTTRRLEYHHGGNGIAAGQWLCSRCHPRGGRVK